MKKNAAMKKFAAVFLILIALVLAAACCVNVRCGAEQAPPPETAAQRAVKDEARENAVWEAAEVEVQGDAENAAEDTENAAEDTENASENTESADEDIEKTIGELIEKLDLGALQEYLDSLSEEQKRFLEEDSVKDALAALLKGDLNTDYGNVFSALAASVFDGLDGLLSVFCVICAVTVLCGVLARFKSSFSEKSTAQLIFFVGYAAVLVLILSSVSAVIADCFAAVSSLQTQMQAAFPVLLTLIATSGGSVSVAVYRPAAAFLGEGIVTVVTGVVFPAAILICVVEMAGHMSGEIRLANFGALAKSVVKWALGGALAVYTVFLTVQGITSATYDGFSFRAARFAIGNSVPIVGGFLSGGLDMLVAGSVLIKNSLGVWCLLLFFGVIAVPLIQLAVYNLFLKLSAAVTEPVGDERITNFLSSLSFAVNYFTAGLLAVGFMYFVTLILLICSSNAVL